MAVASFRLTPFRTTLSNTMISATVKSGFTARIGIIALILPVVLLTIGRSASGDEIILNESNPAFVSGDFACSTFKSANAVGALPIDPQSGTVTAGELVRFFKGHGIVQMDKLVLCMDVNPLDTKDIDLASIELEIRDAHNPQRVIQQFSLDRGGDNSLLLPNYEASAYRPEAQLEINLGYDFMKKFNVDSTETVVLKVQTGNNSSAVPKFFFPAKTKWEFNFFLFGLFASFWFVVFMVLFKFTNPNRQARPTQQRGLFTQKALEPQ